jgi:nucleoside-diphosphate-sugar epimerase
MNQLLATAEIAPVTKHLSPSIARFAGRFLEAIYRIFGIAGEPAITLFIAQQLSTSHWYDISAARRDFGYEVEVSFEMGMERVRAWVSGAQLLNS